MNLKGAFWIVSIAVLLLVFFAFLSSFYLSHYKDYSLSGLAVSDIEDIKDSYSTPEIHWPHMPLTYNYGASCLSQYNGTLKNDIENAVWYIEQKTSNNITFAKVEGSSDIFFNCNASAIGQYSSFVLFAEAEPYVYEGTNIIAKGTVNIYSTYECSGSRPTLVIHELLHLFNLKHRNDRNDIMNPYVRNNCDADISQEDISYLMNIYGSRV